MGRWSRKRLDSCRGMGAHIKGTNGKSQGVVPFLKVVNDTAVAVNQGGRERSGLRISRNLASGYRRIRGAEKKYWRR